MTGISGWMRTLDICHNNELHDFFLCLVNLHLIAVSFYLPPALILIALETGEKNPMKLNCPVSLSHSPRVLTCPWSMPSWWPTQWRWSALRKWWLLSSASPPSVPPRSCPLTWRMQWFSGSTRFEHTDISSEWNVMLWFHTSWVQLVMMILGCCMLT